MIYTITLHPAMDKLVFVDGLVPGGLNRADKVVFRAGGKGINVSREVRRLGGRTVAMGVISGQTGKKIARMLLEKGVPCDFIEVPGETRTNCKIIDRKTGQCTEINEYSPTLSEENLQEMERKIRANVKKGDVVVFSGSAPVNTPADVYRRWIGIASELGAMTVLDADGDLLLEGIQGHPTVVKPNRKELGVLLGRNVDIVSDEVIQSVRDFLTGDMRMIFLTLGPQGAVLVERDNVIFAPAPDVNVVSTVGAGDAMAAAIAVGLSNGYPASEIMQMAVEAAGKTISEDQDL
ncbi:MAG: 1-phosphofructokinase family hexose kinase [Clostridiales bacterium]|nr:1-phosphofructokinase family hexose kinase [Clostridiales bacterium]